MKPIKMLDLQGQRERIQDELRLEMQEVLDSAAFVKGKKVVEFQENLQRYLQVKHVIPVGNGTDALLISLLALGLEKGDEVITTPFTFVSTVEVIVRLGLIPVFVDVCPDTYCIDVNKIESAITSKTKAIVPVHLFGQNADMSAILSLAKKYNLYVLEDACQSIGAEYRFENGNKQFSGCIGDVGCLSFFPSKNLGAFGDGGAILTNNDALSEKARCLANHGMTERYVYEMVGMNSRLDSLQAAVLNVKLRYLQGYTTKRQWTASLYDKAFSSSEYITIPKKQACSEHVYNQYTIQLHPSKNRDVFRKQLEEKGIPTMIYYPIPLHLQSAYSNGRYKEGSFPVSERLARQVLSLPIHTEMDEEQIDYITTTILSLL
ncbi:MAG: DegT/DnrJ/EryC1/StrS family aminotransferase [Bacteroidales bacterium]|nr:DegT/DnrJ/EryC1/StrS family aminotransferase [Bacteroidales bacterium]